MSRDELVFVIRRRIVLNSLFLLGSLVAGSMPTLSVLCFHSFAGGNRYGVTSQDFMRQMRALKKQVDFISLDEAMEVLEGKELSRPAVVVTVDDGYRDVLDILPFVEEERIPVALFALSDPEHANRRELEHRGELLSFDELKMLSGKGWIIGSHSRTHADFSKLTKDELIDEIVGSKKSLEDALGREVSYFAYPRGIYTSDAVGIVRSAGFKAGFSVLPGCIEKGKNPWILPRIVVNKYDEIESKPQIYVAGPLLVGRMLKLLGK